MKIVKIIGILLAVLLAIVLIGGMLTPNEVFRSERSAVINASKADVYAHVSSLKGHQKWSPWADKDPQMKNIFTGEDGAVGSKNAWESDSAKVGHGSQTITKLVKDELVETHMVFTEPKENAGEADAYIKLEDADGGTKTTWGFKMTAPFPANFLASLFFSDDMKAGMDKEVGADFAAGLAKLKALSEKPAYQVKTEDFPARSYAIARISLGMDQIGELGAHYAKHFPTLFGIATRNKVKMLSAPSSLTYVWDEENQLIESSAGIAMERQVEAKGYEWVDLPAGKSLVIDYYGPYDGVGPAHEAMVKYMAANGLNQRLPVIEEYIGDPGQEADMSKVLTRIVYLLE